MTAPRSGPLRRLVERLWLAPWAWIDRHRDPPPGRTSPTTRAAVVFVTVVLCLTAQSYLVLDPWVQRGLADVALDLPVDFGLLGPSPGPVTKLGEHLAWAFGCVTLYLVVPMAVARVVLGLRLRDLGMDPRGALRHAPLYALLALPVIGLGVALAGTHDFQAQYPFYRSPQGWADLLAWELAYAAQFLALEFFFRGFLLHGTRDLLGAWAVPAMVLPYVMIHFQKPMFETLGAAIAGTVLGLLSLRTRSIWGGVFVHVGVAVSMDLAALAARGWRPS